MKNPIILPRNPISPHIPVNNGIIKTVRLVIPDIAPMNAAHITITWDMAMDIRIPDMDIPDVSSPDAIIEQRKTVTCTGWSRRAETELSITLPAETTPQDIERWISEIGWMLGAGYMYRWHNAPNDSRVPTYDFGMVRYEICGIETTHGDRDEGLAQSASINGYWLWEINASYLKAQGATASYWPEWYRCDTSLDEDGSRSGPFPGWEGYNPWLRATQPATGYEAQHFFCPTYKGCGKNKTFCKKKYAVYVKNLKWETRS